MLRRTNWPLIACAWTILGSLSATSGGVTVPINRLSHPISIDGNLSNWGDVLDGGFAITERLDLVDGPPDAGNSAAAFKLAYNDQAIYLAARVVDPSIHTADPIWSGDSLELYLDLRSKGPGEEGLGAPLYSPGVYHFAFAPASVENAKPRCMIIREGKQSAIDIPFACKVLPDGYAMEICIPLKFINIKVDRLADPIGIDIGINDIDFINGKRSERSQYSLGGSASSYNNASAFAQTRAPVAADSKRTRILRVLPARLLPDVFGWNRLPRHSIGGGILVQEADDHKEVPLSISLRYLGNPFTQTPADVQAVNLTETIEEFRIPQLRLVGYKSSATLRAIQSGRYEVATTIDNQPPIFTHFQSGSWSASTHPGESGAASADAMLPNTTANDQYLLFNGWKLSPAVSALSLRGDMPVRMLWTLDGTRLLVQTAGYHDQGVYILDPAKNQIVAELPLGQTWPGMTLSPDGKMIFVSGGGSGKLLPFSLKDLSAMPPIALTKKPDQTAWVAGVAAVAGETGATEFYVADENGDRISIFHAEGRIPKLQSEATLAAGRAPFVIACSPDRKWVAVSNWGGQSVSIIDVATHAEHRVAVDSHPNDIVWSNDGRLYVACSGSNSVKVLENFKVAETIKTSLDPAAPVGSTPIALAISPDQQRLYVANADNNDLVAVDISSPGHSRILGAIPTGWYPSALAISSDGKVIYVGIGKGMFFKGTSTGQYIGGILNGAIEAIQTPTTTDLLKYTRQVIANTPVPQRDMKFTASQQEILQRVFPQIKHVVWIIRENRTYDQVLGDLPFGNGDASLAMFGEDVTPNAHALARQFTLLDNLYCSGEVSQDGHEWCNAAYATDFTEKAWINSYSDRGQPDDDGALSTSPAGYLWDNCRRNHVTYRTYGERADFVSARGSAPVFKGDRGLEGHASLAWAEVSELRDYERAKVFIDEMHHAERTGEWPAYMVMSLGEDHTQGGAAGAFTPNACVASNDQALGEIVDAVSHSKFWPSTAIFVMEDDAQDGPDHVDAHRTVGFVISPYTRRHAVDSTLYTTVSFVHSMEMILKVDPMTQYDSAAIPVFNSMTTQADLTPFDLVRPRIDLAEKNGSTGVDAEASAKLDLSGYDRCDPAALNSILWHIYKPGTAMPAPVRAVHWLH
jgi:DNA-binding beta-propeller fold protein YncE